MIRIVSVFVFLTGFTFAQNKTYVGFESAVTNDVFEIVDFYNELKPVPIIGGRLGVSVQKELNDYFTFKCGFTFKRYKEGFGFKSNNDFAISSTVATLCIPVSLITKLNVYKNKVFFSPIVGIIVGAVPSYVGGASVGKFASSKDSIQFSSYNYSVNTKLFLIQTGLSIDYVFKNKACLSLFTSSYSGVSKIFESTIYYRKNYEQTVISRGFSKGSFWDVIGISYKVPVTKIVEGEKKPSVRP
jgi:hypothetical protein